MTDNRRETLALLSHNEQERLMRAIRGGASRRDLLGMMGALGLGAGLGGSLIGAATTAHAQTPKKGGKIRVAGFGSSTADTLDPAKQSYSTDYCRCTMFYNGLTELDDVMAPSSRSRNPSRTRRRPSGPSSCARACSSMTARS